MKKIKSKSQATISLISLAVIVVAVFAGVFVVLTQRADLRRGAIENGVRILMNPENISVATDFSNFTVDLIASSLNSDYFVNGILTNIEFDPTSVQLVGVSQVKIDAPDSHSILRTLPYENTDEESFGMMTTMANDRYAQVISINQPIPNNTPRQGYISLRKKTSTGTFQADYTFQYIDWQNSNGVGTFNLETATNINVDTDDAAFIPYVIDNANGHFRMTIGKNNNGSEIIDRFATLIFAPVNGGSDSTISIRYEPNEDTHIDDSNDPTNDPEDSMVVVAGMTGNFIDDEIASVNVSFNNSTSQPALILGNITPPNPQSLGGQVNLDLIVDTAGQNTIGFDSIINFNSDLLSNPQIIPNLNQDAGDPDYNPYSVIIPSITPAPTNEITISGSISGDNTEANGRFRVATIRFNVSPDTSGTDLVNFEYTPDVVNNNDSNIVAQGTNGPVDILEQVTNAEVVIQAIAATPTPTATPAIDPTPSTTPTPLPSNVPTPSATATPLPTATPTPIAQTQVTLTIAYKNRTNTSILASQPVTLSYRTANSLCEGTECPSIRNVILDNTGTNTSTFNLAPGRYILRVKVPGYLARTYGTDQQPIIIEGNSASINLASLFPSTPLLGGDFNQDGVVNTTDYLGSNLHPGIIYNFGRRAGQNGTPNSMYSPLVDLDSSSYINIFDFGILRSNWGLEDDQL